MIVKWNNNIVDYKLKVFFFFFSKRYKSILFFFYMLVYVKKKKNTRAHATYDIRDSYYKPVAPALCWCNPPRVRTITPSGSRTRVSGAGGGRSNKERQRLQPLVSGEWGLHTALTGIHVCYIDIPQWVLTRHLSDEPPEWVHIAFRLKTGSVLIAVWKRTASCSTF